MQVLKRNISLPLPDINCFDTAEIVLCSQSIHSWALLWPLQLGSWNSGRKGTKKEPTHRHTYCKSLDQVAVFYPLKFRFSICLVHMARGGVAVGWAGGFCSKQSQAVNVCAKDTAVASLCTYRSIVINTHAGTPEESFSMNLLPCPYVEMALPVSHETKTLNSLECLFNVFKKKYMFCKTSVTWHFFLPYIVVSLIFRWDDSQAHWVLGQFTTISHNAKGKGSNKQTGAVLPQHPL